MFRGKRDKKEPAPEVERAPTSSTGYVRSELTTFDGTGKSTVIVYSSDATGKIVKTRKRVKGADK
ncbi:MAG: hypothetical protein ACR2HY_03735 [Acidimicrobiales bacterium]